MDGDGAVPLVYCSEPGYNVLLVLSSRGEGAVGSGRVVDGCRALWPLGLPPRTVKDYGAGDDIMTWMGACLFCRRRVGAGIGVFIAHHSPTLGDQAARARGSIARTPGQHAPTHATPPRGNRIRTACLDSFMEASAGDAYKELQPKGSW